MAMQWHRYVRPAPAVARRPGRSVKGPHEGRQSEGVWKTIARDSLSRRNGNTIQAPGEARLSRALPNRFVQKRRRVVRRPHDAASLAR